MGRGRSEWKEVRSIWGNVFFRLERGSIGLSIALDGATVSWIHDLVDIRYGL